MILITRSRLSAAQTSSSFKWLETHTSTSTMPTFKTEALHLLKLTTVVLNDCYSEVMAYTVLAYSVFTTYMDAKVTPTEDIDYSCHIKP